MSAKGRFETLPGCRHGPAADLDVRILGQLPVARLPRGDALEPGPLEVGGFNVPLRGGPLGSSRWNTRRGTRTPPWYSPISTANSTACCSAFQWASSGKVEEHGASPALIGLLRVFSKRSSPGLQRLPTVSRLGGRPGPRYARDMAVPVSPPMSAKSSSSSRSCRIGRPRTSHPVGT